MRKKQTGPWKVRHISTVHLFPWRCQKQERSWGIQIRPFFRSEVVFISATVSLMWICNIERPHKLDSVIDDLIFSAFLELKLNVHSSMKRLANNCIIRLHSWSLSPKYSSAEFQGCMIQARNCCARYFATNEFLMENRPETGYHFCIFYNRFYLIIIQFVEVTGHQVKAKEHGFNFLWKSGIQMTDWTINERIQKTYFKMLFSGFCGRVCCVSLSSYCMRFLLRLCHLLPRWMTPFRINDGKIHYRFYEYHTFYQPKA